MCVSMHFDGTPVRLCCLISSGAPKGFLPFWNKIVIIFATTVVGGEIKSSDVVAMRCIFGLRTLVKYGGS